MREVCRKNYVIFKCVIIQFFNLKVKTKKHFLTQLKK